MKEPHTQDHDRAQTLHIHVGQPLEIDVGPSDAQTGYVWMMRELPSCVALESTQDVAPQPPQHGRLASRVFRVVGCHQGDGFLRCVLARPWNPGESVDERRYRMVVDPDAVASP